MTPITFRCEKTVALTADAITQQILCVERWRDFRGFWPIPGVKSAEFERRTEQTVGSRIRVTNRDGSTHVEEITKWEPKRRMELRMGEFSPPLSLLATEFIEAWELQPVGDETAITRSFQLFARSFMTKPVVWLISFLLKRAIARHLDDLSRDSVATPMP